MLGEATVVELTFPQAMISNGTPEPENTTLHADAKSANGMTLTELSETARQVIYGLEGGIGEVNTFDYAVGAGRITAVGGKEYPSVTGKVLTIT